MLLISAQNFEDEETEVEELYEKLRKHLSVKDLSLVISTLTGINKNQLYKKFLQLSKNLHNIKSWSSLSLSFAKRKVRLHRVCQLTAGEREFTESATENRPPNW